MAETLSDVMKSINKKFGENIMKVGVDDLTEYGTLSIGSPGFDFCLYNSFPEGRIIEFCGAESSGKTSTAMLACAAYQKKELERNPNEPRAVLYVDLECGVDPMWASKFGFDMSSNAKVPVIAFRPEAMSAEDIFDVIIDSVKTGQVGFIILDSLSMLVPQLTLDESMSKKDMGGIAKVLGDFVKKITSLLVKYKCTLIGINQVRENIGGYGNPIITSGGRAWKHGCAVRLMFKRGEFFDEDGNTLKTSAESPAGYVMDIAVLKTKVCKWDRKLGRICINYDRGIDILQDTIDVATYFGLIDNSVQGTFKILDVDTGEVLLDDDGQEVKIRGKKNLKPYFERHLDIWKKLYDATYEKLSRKDDPNIISFEKMLSIDVGKAFGVNLDGDDEQ